MNSYRKKLIILYLLEVKLNYSIKEIASNLGLSVEKIDILLTDMMEQNLIGYNDYNLVVTEKGIESLGNLASLYNTDYNQIETFKIYPTRAMPIDEPYVPKKFSLD